MENQESVVLEKPKGKSFLVRCSYILHDHDLPVTWKSLVTLAKAVEVKDTYSSVKYAKEIMGSKNTEIVSVVVVKGSV